MSGSNLDLRAAVVHGQTGMIRADYRKWEPIIEAAGINGE